MKLPRSSSALNTSWLLLSPTDKAQRLLVWKDAEGSSYSQHHYNGKVDQEQACPLLSAPAHLAIFR